MRLLFLFLILVTTKVTIAQDKYWITFKDKNIQGYNYEKNLSKETLNNRIRFGLPLYQYTDVPVSNEYMKGLQNNGVQILNRSKWLNSVSAFLNPNQVEQILLLPYVKEVSLIDRKIQVTGTSLNVKPADYDLAIKQMGAELFKEKDLSGKGVSVGVIDAGFYKAIIDNQLAHLFEEKKIIRQRDFLTPPVLELVGDEIKESDHHGRIVLSWIAGYDASAKAQRGLAVNSKFYLARTENEAREYRGEEDNWIMAMEWMDSLGVRLINTSLGYSINMDDPKDNYKKAEMDGKTAKISKAAQIATGEKGIFLVVSAGNEGGITSSWKIVSAPADAEGVLSIGATKDNWERIGYSSIGPEELPYLKPNVSCYSLYGTSFSAPAVTGFVACLMERDSTLNNKQLKQIVEKSGHLYPYGNNYIGYGVPQAGKALKLIENKDHEFANCVEKKVKGKKATFKFDKTMTEVVVFHKKNKTVVLQQTTLKFNKGKLLVKRLPGAARTTVSLGLDVIEIIWE
jgi:subtilisin family serine protease